MTEIQNRQLLHSVFGGEPISIDSTGNAPKRYFILHMHRLPGPSTDAPGSAPSSGNPST
ncbi:MAG: hypothetical protein ACLPX9_11145 [Rhodomicrobium sp.]